MTTAKIAETARGADWKKLNAMQRTFVECLLADETFNATRAAKRAGYKAPAQAASKLMSQRSVRAIIGKALKQRLDRLRLEADDVLMHLQTALFLDPAEVFRKTPIGTWEVRPLDEIPQEIRRCITKIKQRTKFYEKYEEVTTELEFMSKDAALTNALKHLGLVGGDQYNVRVGIDLSQLVEKLEERRNVIDGDVIRRIAESTDAAE